MLNKLISIGIGSFEHSNDNLEEILTSKATKSFYKKESNFKFSIFPFKNLFLVLVKL